MRRWRRPGIREEEFDLDDDEDEDDEEEEERRYIPPRPLRVTRFSDFEGDENEGVNLERFNKIQGLIRAGKYKPKQADPWIAHILYSNLKELGEI
jgi:hypothetical protein